jgi:tetratricopeptide (TPR) repeat protein
VIRSKEILIFTFSLGLIWLMVSCSSESTAPLNRAFHNTTGKYNAYFIGLQRLNEVEESVWSSMKPDYNHVLHVYPPLDSTMAQSYSEQLEDCIKKASIVIQYHENSKWVDDSYNLIGRARMYGYDFPNATTTFKYVNTTGEDENAKHWAIVNLMRVFIENGEMANAEEASEYLEDQILNKKNLKHLYLTRAYYYQTLDDKDNMVRNLVLADPLLDRSERARYYFIIGQIYQEIGFSSAAYEYYRKCISSNPNYELSFYAKLNIAQVTELGDSKDLKNVRKYFKKLVKDEKNIEFQDRIYYEWGKFELKQGNLAEAKKYFNRSIQTSVSDNRQKGVSYISLGEIYYDTLADYSTAQAYYDSAVQVLPKTYENYSAVKTRAEVLNDFVTQLNTISLQDSLLSMAAMDSTEVMSLYMTLATMEQEAAEALEEEVRREERQVGSLANFDEPTGVGSTSWYFSNPSAVAAGRTSFRQVWGTRQLEDHWRRSIKQAAIANTTNINDANEGVDVEEKEELSRDQLIINSANKKFARLPRTDEEKKESHAMLEKAYYSIGKIYYFDLEEKENAIEAFKKLLKDYPESEYTAEGYYLLYLIYEDQQEEILAQEIIDYMHAEMPNSIYTKLIDNPNYEEDSNQANEILSKEYKVVYQLYQDSHLDSASQIINNLLSQYPDVSFSANLRLLQILIIGRTQPLADYQLELQEFIDLYPDHELKTYAQELLDASKTYRSNLVKLKAAEYFDTKTGEFFFVVVSAKDSMAVYETTLTEIAQSDFPDQELEIGTLNLSDTVQLSVVEPFKNMDEALLYLDLTKAGQYFDIAKNPYFIISKSNFDILYKSKELDAYLVFYQEHF